MVKEVMVVLLNAPVAVLEQNNAAENFLSISSLPDLGLMAKGQKECSITFGARAIFLRSWLDAAASGRLDCKWTFTSVL